jgi:hypothetical protein
MAEVNDRNSKFDPNAFLVKKMQAATIEADRQRVVIAKLETELVSAKAQLRRWSPLGSDRAWVPNEHEKSDIQHLHDIARDGLMTESELGQASIEIEHTLLGIRSTWKWPDSRVRCFVAIEVD